MIVFGVILLVLGYVLGISLLYTIGGILLLVGVILWVLGATGHPFYNRRHYY